MYNFRFFLVVLLLVSLSGIGFAEDIFTYSKSDYWQNIYGKTLKDSPETADAAIEFLRAFFLNAQKVRGDLKYELTLMKGEETKKQNQAEQAAALLAVAELNRARGTEPTRRQVMLGLDLFARSCRPHPCGAKVISLPDQATTRTATVAYYCLALCNFLAAEQKQMPEVLKQQFNQILKEQLQFMESMKLPDGGWSGEYDFDNSFAVPSGSITGDAVVLWAYIRIAAQVENTDILPVIQKEIKRQIDEYVLPGLQKTSKLPDLRVYFQTAGMAVMEEYLAAGWQEHQADAFQALMAMGWNIFYSDRIAINEANTAKVALGLVPFMKQLKKENNPKATLVENRIFELLDDTLQRQVGGPMDAVNQSTAFSEECLGAVLNRREADTVRITDTASLLRALLAL